MFENKKENFSQREERILDFWEREKIFQKSVQNREKSSLFSVYDGPPFATGKPHYGHLLAGTIKDVVPRYKTMKGYHVPRRFGWDCHGLPVESEIERQEKLSEVTTTEQFDIASFNEKCRNIVLRYSEDWQRTVNRMGRWVDFNHTYRTMDRDFMESVWWIFGELWKQNLIYEGFKVMPFSVSLSTPLSNFEANLNYQEVDDPSIVVSFPLIEDPSTSLLVWTTTPWTLPSNLAIMVGENLDYVKIEDREGKRYILSRQSLATYFTEEVKILKTFKGTYLKGKRYQPLFDYFIKRASHNAFTILTDNSVSKEEGTGIVHIAPAFGEIDFFACEKAGIEWICPVDSHGKFTHEIPDLTGVYVKDADKKLIKHIKSMGRLMNQKVIRHRYPFCWRSDTPLIYKVVHTWFVSVEKIKERLLEANEQIYWIPSHLKHGRFGRWLEEARDWAISRNRYWGTPIPIWRNSDGESIVIDSVKNLESRSGKRILDLHRHHIDSVTFEERGKKYIRIPEVFDCWFESGSMPYAQNHFPFEHKEQTLRAFPAEFIAEGLDQTRGWFYTLNILSTALFKKPAFKNVIVNGIILTEDGAKMSKRLKNYPDPESVIHKYGADAVRLYLLHSSAVQGDDLRFCERGVALILRQFLIPLWNAYIFLSTYAKIYHWSPDSAIRPNKTIDLWIVSLMQRLIYDVERGMEKYALNEAVDPFLSFITQLTNWYIRRCRNRFWSDKNTDDRREAFQTLYIVLLELCKVAAPFIPFISDAMYQELRKKIDPHSVHLCNFPSYNHTLRNKKLEMEMALVQNVVSMGHALRKEHKLKVRQPLSKAHLISSDPTVMECLKSQEHLILEELNVKAIDYHREEQGFVEVKIKPNFRTLGKRVGPLMNKMQAAILSLKPTVLDQDIIHINLDGKTFFLKNEDVLVERKVKSGLIAATEGGITIALDITISDALAIEGLAREIVNKVNTQRKKDDFEVTDRIILYIEATPSVQKCFEKHKKYITGEVLAQKVYFEKKEEGSTWNLNGEWVKISLKKA